jgi:hypothetical protein
MHAHQLNFALARHNHRPCPNPIAADWAVGGAETIARVRMTDPATYFRVVASILPKDVLVNVQQQTPGNLEPDEWRVLWIWCG